MYKVIATKEAIRTWIEWEFAVDKDHPRHAAVRNPGPEGLWLPPHHATFQTRPGTPFPSRTKASAARFAARIRDAVIYAAGRDGKPLPGGSDVAVVRGRYSS